MRIFPRFSQKFLKIQTWQNRKQQQQGQEKKKGNQKEENPYLGEQSREIRVLSSDHSGLEGGG